MRALRIEVRFSESRESGYQSAEAPSNREANDTNQGHV
jgi:hypothetical protein